MPQQLSILVAFIAALYQRGTSVLLLATFGECRVYAALLDIVATAGGRSAGRASDEATIVRAHLTGSFIDAIRAVAKIGKVGAWAGKPFATIKRTAWYIAACAFVAQRRAAGNKRAGDAAFLSGGLCVDYKGVVAGHGYRDAGSSCASYIAQIGSSGCRAAIKAVIVEFGQSPELDKFDKLREALASVEPVEPPKAAPKAAPKATVKRRKRAKR